MGNKPMNQYRSVQIETASQEQLIMLLYEHAIRAVQIAREAMPIKKYDTVSNNIIKAQDIVTELMVSLRMDVGPIAQNLYRVYDYLNNRLIEANMKKDVKMLEEVETHLSELKTAWDDAFRKAANRPPAAAPGRPIPAAAAPKNGGFSVSG